MDDKDKYILLAEDDEDDIEFFRDCFIEVCSQIKLLVARNGRKLMEFLSTGIVPYCIILDLNMPVMNGQDCLVEIRRQPILNNTKVVILSTSNSDYHRKDCLIKGADDYFVKPNNIDQLKRLVHHICNI